MKTKIAWGLIIIIIICFLIGIIYLEGKEISKIKTEIFQQEIAKENLNNLYKLKVTNWIAKNSNRITYATTKQIAEEALKVKHPILVLSVVSVESEFNPSAVSYKGAIGLGQIMYNHWGTDLIKQGIILHKRDLFGIRENLKSTSYILDLQMTRTGGDIVKALKFYLGTNHLSYTNKIFTAYVSLSSLKD